MIRTLAIPCIVIGFSVGLGDSLAQDQNPERHAAGRPDSPGRTTESIAQLFGAYHELGAFNGAALVAEDGEVLFHGAFGPAVVEFDVPNQVDTRYRIASISKVMTAVVVLQLVEDGRIDLDRPIGAYAKTVREDIATRVKVRQLLNHSSGLSREYLADPELTRAYPVCELVEAINKDVQFVAEPGAESTYSNAGFVLLAAVVEGVTGERFERVLERRVFAPAGMTNSGVELLPTEVIQRLAIGYRLRFGTYTRADAVNMSTTRGNGGVYSTVDDLYKFERALRNGTLLRPASRAQMFRAGPGNYGLAWQIRENEPGFPEGVGRLAWHRGANRGGFRTQITVQLDGDRVVILLANLDDSPRLEITKKLFEIMVDGRTTLPEPSLADTVMALLRKNGADAALSEISRARSSDESAAATAVNVLVAFGHHSIRAQRPTEAVKVFELCDRAYPGIPDIIVSLAYAHACAGDREAAARFARRTLELDPQNADALDVLSRVSPDE